MAGLALVDVLQDFGAPKRAAPRPEVPAPPPEPLRSEPQPETELLPEFDAERAAAAVAEAVAEAEAALAQRLSGEHAEAIASLESRHAEELARLRGEFAEEAGRRIAERLAELEQQVVALTSSTVARILGMALTEDVSRAAVDELSRNIVAAIGDREAVRIRVSGPVSLFEALRPGLGRFAGQMDFTEAPGFDLSVSVDSTLFETRLAEWSSALSEVLA